MPEETTAIATTNEQAIAVNPVEAATPFINTLDASTVEGKLTTANALNSAVSLNDYVETPLQIVDLIQTAGIRKARDKNQIDTPCTNTYLIGADGQAYFSQSEGVARSARNILAIFPDLNKPEGLKMVCSEMQLPNGNSIKQIAVTR